MRHDIPEDSLALLDHRLEPHDANQLELKLAYLIRPGTRAERYRVESYMFVSRTLGIDPNTYRSQDFYADTAAFLRFKTPRVALAELADPAGARDLFSPVTPWAEFLANHAAAGWRAAEEELVTRLKLIGCIYRSAIRDEARDLLEGALGDDEAPPLSGVERAEGFVRIVAKAIARLREVGQACELEGTPSRVREIWHAVDEYVALVAEDNLTDIVVRLDALSSHGEDPPGVAPVRRAAADLAVEQFQYRRERGFPSWLRPDAPNEMFSYRQKLLKRALYSALYLDVRQDAGGRLMRDLVGMLAAALAMLFAVLIAIWAQLALNLLSWPFVAVMVISYMFKDRIKEWGRQYLGRRLLNAQPDHVIRIRDGKGRRIGRCEEVFRVSDPSRVPEEIRQARHRRHAEVEVDGRPEVVVCYRKDIELDAAKLAGALQGLEGLNDIMRFNLRRLRERMDEPVEHHRLVHPTTRRVETVPCARVYHVNIVLRLTVGEGDDQRSQIERVKVIMDQNGIRRVELPAPIGADGKPGDDKVIAAA